MTQEQFLSAMSDIDDKFLKEIAHTSDEIFEWDHDSEKPQIIRLESRPFPLWKKAAVTATSICILAAGIVGVSKLYGIQSAGSSPEVSLSSSDISDSYTSIADKLNSEINDIRLSKINSVITGGHEFNGVLSEPKMIFVETELTTKTDDQNFAVVQISSTEVVENYELHILIYRKEERDGYTDGFYDRVPVADIDIDDITRNKENTYIIDYNSDISAGDELILVICANREYSEKPGIEGKWLP